MSGGSFNYLCHCDTDDLKDRLEDMAEMRDMLEAKGLDKAAKETDDLINLVKELEGKANGFLSRLSSIWKAVEWTESGDWGEDSIKRAAKELEENTKA